MSQLLNFNSNENHNFAQISVLHHFSASTALMVTFEESQFQTISDISPLFSDTQLRGKIKFKRLQTNKLTIAEKLGTGKTTDTVHSTVLRKHYRLVL